MVCDSSSKRTNLLETRIKTKKIHCVLEFNQSEWLKSYTEFNIQKRIEAEKNGTKDSKPLCKLMNNAIYGKIMENVRNRINVKLTKNEKDYLKCTSKPSYLSHKIFGNNLVAIHKSKLVLKLNKPEYTGMCILELSKVLMYGFHLDYIKNKYDSKSKLLFTDPDSLMYEIKIEDANENFNSDKEMFSFTNYSTRSKYFKDSNKLAIGKMKYESGGVAIKKLQKVQIKMS